MEKINITDKPAQRITITGKAMPRIEPEEFAKALGAEQVPGIDAKVRDIIDLIEMGQLILNGRRDV